MAAAPAAADREPEPELGDSSDGGFGASFESEEVLASSSAFSFDDNPDLAEAVEAFAHPDSLDAPARPEPDPLTTPVPEPDPEAEAFAPEPVSDDVLARGISQSFDATEVHAPDPSPAAGDDLYDDFDNADSADLFADSADGGIPLAEPASVATEVVSEWDEDPESLSQSALEPLPDGNTSCRRFQILHSFL